MKKIAEVLVVSYAAGCALLCIPFAVVLTLSGLPIVPQTTDELTPLYCGVLIFIALALVAMVYAMARKPKQSTGVADVAG